MKARSVNEAMNFERGLDPKESMNIGIKNNAKLVKTVFLQKLNAIGINPKWKDSKTYNGDIYEIEIPQRSDLFITYATDEAAQGEWDEPGGFWIQDNEGDKWYLDPTHSIEKVVKKIINLVYGSPASIEKKIKQIPIKIQKLEKELEALQKIKESLTKP